MPKDNKLLALLVITLCAKLLAISVLMLGMRLGAGWVGHVLVDIAGWLQFWKDTQAGAIPYVDITREYPVGAGMIYWGIGSLLNLNDWGSLVYRHALAMVPPDLLNVALLYAILKRIDPEGKRAWWLTLLWTLTPTGLVLGTVRFEGYVVFFALLGFYFHQGKRPMLATLVWSLGCWFKWYPAFFIAAQEIDVLYRLYRREEGTDRWQWLKSTALFIAVALVVNLPFIIAGEVRHNSYQPWIAPYWFHANRPLYWDTVLGVLTLYSPPGAIWWERLAPRWTILLMLILFVVRPMLKVEARGALICLAAVWFNRVYSTQFNLWFDPFLLIVIAQVKDRRWFWGLVVAYILTDLQNIFIYPFSFTYCLLEIGGFGEHRAAELGKMWTVLFCQAIVVRMGVVTLWIALLLYDPTRLPAQEVAPLPAKRKKR